jgi:Flp pilus assembly protein TadD
MNASADYTRLAGYLASDPDNLELLAAVVDAAIDGGVPERAVAHADHALARAPGHPQFIYRRAVALRRCDRLDEARAALEALVAAGETHPVPLCELAEILLAQRDFEGCLALLDRLSATGPDHAVPPQADLLRVRALHHLGRVDEAITCAEAVLAAQSQRADIAAALATLYLDAERLDDAARMHAQAAAGGRLDAELHAVGGYLALAAEDEALAQQRFAQALALRPHEGRALLGAGLAAAARNDLPAAIVQLRAAAEAMPTHLGTWNALAWMQLFSGDLDGAEAALAHANTVDPTFSENHGSLAVIAAMRGQTARAQELLRTAQRLDRNSFSAAYAALLLQHGPQGGEAVLQQALAFLARQPAPGGGSMQQTVLRLASRGRR